MDRWQRMTEFLRYLASITKSSPDFVLDKNNHVFYSELTRIGVPEEDREFFVGGYFETWIKEFENRSDISVFVSPRWTYFCQFVTGNLLDERTHIKMYIPFKTEMIHQCANELFDFLAKNNIKHSSKIGKNARVDGVVVRVGSKQDALSVARFIENHPHLRDSLYEPNPFLLNDGNIAYATDANYSFNEELTNYLYEYMSKCYKEGTLDTVNIRDFFLHVQNSYNEVFCLKDREKIMDYMEERQIDFNTRRFANLANKSEIVKLLLHSMSAEDNLNRVMEVYDELMDKDYMKDMEDSFKVKKNEINNPTEEITNKTVVINSSSEKLISAVYANYNKYGYNHALNALKKFVETGTTVNFTKDSNSRSIISTFTSQEVKNIIVSECGSLNYDLFMNVMLQKKALEMKSNALEQACIGTLNKYDIAQVKYAIEKAIDKKDFTSFSNCGDLQLRSKLMRNVRPEEIQMLMKAILIKYGIDNENDLMTEFLDNLLVVAKKKKEEDDFGQR